MKTMNQKTQKQNGKKPGKKQPGSSTSIGNNLKNQVGSSLFHESHKPTEEELKRRRQRFAASQVNRKKQPEQTTKHDPVQPIVGRCMSLEKSYFRLTSDPDPNMVRPESVLKKAYKRLKQLWKEGYSTNYLLDQLKAIRQDLVVQHISNKLTVKVYELNARVAIFANDMNELNQCQSMLFSLYKTIPSKHQMNFLSYNLIYDVIHNNIIDIHRHVQHAQIALTNQSIQHSLLVLQAVRTNDYPYYLQLIKTASNESRQLMEYYLPTFRHAFLKTTLLTVFPSISLSHLSELTHVSKDALRTELEKAGFNIDDTIDIVKNKALIAHF